jgi:hypothetical protein
VRSTLALACLALSLSASCASGRQEVSGAWLIGTWHWVGGQSVFEFKDGADVITWTMRRERFLSTRPGWGEKAAVEVAGTVTELTAGTVELGGRYEHSDRTFLVGRPFRFWLRRESDGTLRGEALGAGGELLPAVLRKVE